MFQKHKTLSLNALYSLFKHLQVDPYLHTSGILIGLDTNLTVLTN